MPSDARSEILDLERGLPTTREDVAALKKLREQRPITTQEFLRFLAGLAAPTYQTLRSRRGPRGEEPFRL
jgi:hypothetical protein